MYNYFCQSRDKMQEEQEPTIFSRRLMFRQFNQGQTHTNRIYETSSDENQMVEIVVCKEGDLVFAKCKGYPPWPGQIIRVMGNGIYKVKFFGHPTTANILWENLEEFNEVTQGRYRKQYETSQKSIDKRVIKAIEKAYAALNIKLSAKLKQQSQEQGQVLESEKIKKRRRKLMSRQSRSKEGKTEDIEQQVKKTIQKYVNRQNESKSGQEQANSSTYTQKQTKKSRKKEKSLSGSKGKVKSGQKGKSGSKEKSRSKGKVRPEKRIRENSTQTKISPQELSAEIDRLMKINRQTLARQIQSTLQNLQEDITALYRQRLTRFPQKLMLHSFLNSPNLLTASSIASSRILERMLMFVKCYEIMGGLEDKHREYGCQQQYELVKQSCLKMQKWWDEQAIKENVNNLRRNVVKQKLRLMRAYPH